MTTEERERLLFQMESPKRIANRQMRAVWPLLLLFVCRSLNAESVNKGILSPLKAVDLPCPLGSRNVQALVLGEDGRLHGASFGKDVWLFIYDPQAAKLIWSLNLFKHQPQERSFPKGSLATLAGNKFVVSYMSPVEGRKYGLGGMSGWRFVEPETTADTRFRWIMSGSSDFVALVGDAQRPIFYGLSATGRVIRYGLGDNTFDRAQDLGAVGARLPQPDTGPYRYSLPEPEHLSRVLVLDSEGTVYTVGENGFIVRGSVEGRIEMEKMARAPVVPRREEWATLDAAVLGPDGLIYGGTFDGYIFTFNSKTNEVINLGKPLREGRVQGLAFSKGKLIGVGGEKDSPQAFAFDPKTRGFELGGTLQTTDGKTVTEAVGAMVADKNGNIYLGTVGQQGNLYVWGAK